MASLTLIQIGGSEAIARFTEWGIGRGSRGRREIRVGVGAIDRTL